MKRDCSFYAKLYEGLCSDLDVPKRDLIYIQTRLSNEGLSFLTDVLPQLSKAMLSGLESNAFRCPDSFQTSNKSEMPRFLGTFLRKVFNDDGRFLREIDDGVAHAIYVVRQICEVLYKADFPRREEKDQLVIDRFIQTEKELNDWHLPSGDNTLFLARQLIRTLFKDFFKQMNGHCGFGPGVCSDAKVVDKFTTTLWDSPALRQYHDAYFWNVAEKMEDRNIRMSNSSLFNGQLSAQVILVDKDARGPRLISCEPVTNQWLQTFLEKSIVKYVENHELTTQVRFSDQTWNRDLAESNSITRYSATVDLKDASDRVPLALVEYLFQDTILLKPLLACRTPRTRLPDGRTICLKKFAPMGSACCFPIMALTIWALVNAQVSLDRGYLVSDSCHVYGDDIIVGVSDLHSCRVALKKGNLMINEDKSYDEAFFRESCGADFFAGWDVTPKRFRKVPSADLSAMENSFRLITFLNELEGFPSVQKFLQREAEDCLGKKIAYSSRTIPGTIRVHKMDERLRTNQGRYVIIGKPEQGEHSASGHSLFHISFNRIGKDVTNSVSDADLRKTRFRSRKIKITEWSDS